MVLAIGLLVDDAIVVVENVRRIMRDEGLPAREATKSMGEISGALVAIAGALCGIPADGLLRQLHRGDLPSVLGHHHFQRCSSPWW